MEAYGPALPPSFKTTSENITEKKTHGESGTQKRSIGPVLPPGIGSSNAEVDSAKEKTSSDGETASSSPSHSVSVIGPAMPPGFKRQQSDTEDSSESSDSSSEDESGKDAKERRVSEGQGMSSNTGSHLIGPVMPTQVQSQDGEEMVIGPLPGQGSSVELSKAEEFERRAQKMKDKLQNKDKGAPVQREEWMMTLPEKMRRNIGVEAKSSFSRSRCTGEIDSTWTETPADRERREQEQSEGKHDGRKRTHEDDQVQSSRDVFMAQQVEDYNKKKKRGYSLLELHQKKIEKKKKKEKKKEKKKRKKEKKEGKETKQRIERRPFDREQDLKTNHFDDAMKRSVIKKARGIGGRFGAGNQQYL